MMTHIDKDSLKLNAARFFKRTDLPFMQREVYAAKYLVDILFQDIMDKGGKPYTGHLYRVASGVEHAVKPAALMHDLVEDIKGWNFQDLADIGFGKNTVQAVQAVTKKAGEYYFDAMVRAGRNPSGLQIKRSDLRDNSNVLRLDRLPSDKDYERIRKYFLADKYLADVQSGAIPAGTAFQDWMLKQPANMQDFALLDKNTAPKKPHAPRLKK